MALTKANTVVIDVDDISDALDNSIDGVSIKEYIDTEITNLTSYVDSEVASLAGTGEAYTDAEVAALDADITGRGYLLSSQNLGDITDAASARSNLEVFDATGSLQMQNADPGLVTLTNPYTSLDLPAGWTVPFFIDGTRDFRSNSDIGTDMGVTATVAYRSGVTIDTLLNYCPDATTGEKGRVELATNTEAQAGLDNERVITCQGLSTTLSNYVAGSANIGTAAVKQGHLNTSSGTVSTTSTSFVQLILPGGEYGFYPQFNGTEFASLDSDISVTGTFQSIVSLSAPVAGTAQARQRYINASPPYNLGDGDIPLFVYALVDKSTDKIVSTYVAEDPPWAHNGPTRTTPDYYVDDIGYQIQKKINKKTGEIEDKIIVVDQSVKNKDSKIFPHPFLNVDTTKFEVVLLDPVETMKLKELYIQGEDISTLLHKNKITLSNESLSRKVPDGVTAAKFAFKKTK